MIHRSSAEEDRNGDTVKSLLYLELDKAAYLLIIDDHDIANIWHIMAPTAACSMDNAWDLETKTQAGRFRAGLAPDSRVGS